MARMHFPENSRWLTQVAGTLLTVGLATAAAAQTEETLPLDTDASEPAPVTAAVPLSITVTSPLDGEITADGALTLREAIALANGTLTVAELSAAEQALVQPAGGPGSTIGFDLPSNDTTIELTTLLPPILTAGTVIDGTTQTGYGAAGAYPGIPVPAVSLTPATDTEVLRGLTIAADDVTVRGLSLYGFTSTTRATLTTPPADIFISNAPPPVDAGRDSPPVDFFAFDQPEDAVSGTVLELNWLGVPPSEEIPVQRSGFGVSVFNSIGAEIRQNRIQHHSGSGVITAVRAEDMALTDNVIVGNGVAGMPDAVRLEGQLTGATIQGNLICGNDGSGIYLFKPDGATLIQNNDIRFNGRRFNRAAVYVMGDDHQIVDNAIGYQPGPGVAVAAFPKSDRNLIRGNQFAALNGLSIDLTTQQNVDTQAFQVADGPNPPRDSHFSRVETANGAINAPTFEGYTFERQDGVTVVTGKADPGTEVEIYQIVEDDGVYSPLNTPLATVTTDADGSFTWTWEQPEGVWIAATATDPAYGTSEPSPVIQVQGADGTVPPLPVQLPYVAACEPPAPPPEPEPEPVPPPAAPIQLEVPRNIHFALDRSDISPESAAVLDQIAAAMLEYPFLVVELRGHTDPRASDAYNQALSQRRAQAARDYLQRQGVAPERMRIVPLGESQRATSGDSRVDFARDRRVEFVFQDTRGLDILFVPQEEDLQVEPAR